MEKPAVQEPSRGRDSGIHRGFRFKFRKRRVRYVALLPTVLTLCNGICGMLAILQVGLGLAAQPPSDPAPFFQAAGYLILVGMIFDAVDGKVARVTRTASSFGAQVDSFCDLLTFGAAPAFLAYAIAHASRLAHQGQYWLPERIVLVVCVFYAMCALIRLARFTVETTPDDKSHLEFQGLPSPAAAGVVASGLIPWHAFPDWPVLQDIVNAIPRALPVTVFLLGVLMVSRIRYVHVVNRLFRGFRPFVTLVELALVAIFVVIFYEFALFLAFVGYAAIGPVLWAVNRAFRRSPAPEAAASAAEPRPPEDPLF